MPAELVVNVIIAGVLTGMVYGLMALGLSVIFGVVRVVNFAHGEMMAIAMYAAVTLFAAFKLDPFLAAVPIAIAFFALGYLMQAGLINPFISRPEHSQFMLMVAVAIIMVNGLLIAFGPDARNVQTDYQLDSWEFGKILVDKPRAFAALMAAAASGALFLFFRRTLTGKAIRRVELGERFEEFAEEVCERIRTVRLEQGVSVDELAAALGVTKGFVHSWENANRKAHGRKVCPTLERIVQIAIALGVRPIDLIPEDFE